MIEEALERERLAHDDRRRVSREGLERLSARGKHEHRRRAVLGPLAQLAHHLVAAHDGHADVGDDEAMLRPQPGEAFGAVARDGHLVTEIAERLAVEPQEGLVILDHEDPQRHYDGSTEGGSDRWTMLLNEMPPVSCHWCRTFGSA